MLVALLVKMLTTALIVVAVTVTVGHLGPRLGGIMAGTPIIFGPGYFFMLREQSPEFVAVAAVSSLHAVSATLLFTVCYVIAAKRLGALASVGLAALSWLPGAFLFTSMPNILSLALAAYLLVYLAARRVDRLLSLPQTGASYSSGWSDVLAKSALAGVVVGVATTLAANFGPLPSGLLMGFPVGILTIGLTLHQRYGAPVARATIAATQPALFSLVAFAASIGLTVQILPPMLSFICALLASLTVSAALVLIGQRHTKLKAT